MGVTLRMVRVERDHPAPGSYGARTVRGGQLSPQTPATWVNPHAGARAGATSHLSNDRRTILSRRCLRVRRTSDYTLWGGAALLGFDALSDGRDLTEEPYRPLLRNRSVETVGTRSGPTWSST